MKTFGPAITALIAAALAGAQSLPPSPTASVGCEPHGDHWHCEGPATVASVTAEVTTTSDAAIPTSSADDHDDHDDHESDHEEGTGSIAPSPTESIGCEPHGDHWHCDGPAESGAAASATESFATESIAPSPTESVGCEPHGDHWHCDGPAETASESGATESGAAETQSSVPTAAAGDFSLNRAALAGGVLAAVGMAL